MTAFELGSLLLLVLVPRHPVGCVFVMRLPSVCFCVLPACEPTRAHTLDFLFPMHMSQTALLWGKTPGASLGYPIFAVTKEETPLFSLAASKSSLLCCFKYDEDLFFLKVFVKGRLVPWIKPKRDLSSSLSRVNGWTLLLTTAQLSKMKVLGRDSVLERRSHIF